MKKLQIITFFILVYNFGYSQNTEIEKLMGYKTIRQTFCKSYGDWSYVYELNNGLAVRQKNYSRKELTNIQNNIYDSNKNIIYEISNYDRKNGYKIDTVSRYSNKYDEKNRLIEKRYHFGMIEKYSDFDKNSKPKLIERFNEDNRPEVFWPINEKFEYDAIGNLIKEIKTELEYAINNDSINKDPIKRYKVEINTYKYDSFGNIVQLKREFSPKEEFPIIMAGGLPLYETEEFEYKYNKKGLWTKKYWIVNGKKTLREKRGFKL